MTATTTVTTASTETATAVETATDAPTVVATFLAALGRGDYERLEACLAPDVWFRALLPKRLREHSTARETVEAYRSWYDTAAGSQMVRSDHYTMAGREYLSYRFRLVPDWAPDQWHVIEQAGFCRVKSGRISRLDVVCTGFHPIG